MNCFPYEKHYGAISCPSLHHVIATPTFLQSGLYFEKALAKAYLAAAAIGRN